MARFPTNRHYPDDRRQVKPSKDERRLSYDELIQHAARALYKASEAASEEVRKDFIEVAEMWGSMADLMLKSGFIR